MYADMSIDIDGCDANGNHVSTWSDLQWDAYYAQNSDNSTRNCSPPSYQYKFYDLEALVTSKVFQEQLRMALEHKQREIDMLRKELLQMLENEYSSRTIYVGRI